MTVAPAGLRTDRVPDLAGVSAPVFGPGGRLAGALTLTMLAERLKERHAPPVQHPARQLTASLGGVRPGPAP